MLLVIAIVSAPTVASATDLVFMLIPGIPGASLSPGHVGWIQLFSFSGNAISPDSASKGKNNQGCQLTVTKQLDIAGPRLWAATVTGQKFSTIRIQVVQGGASNFIFYDILLTGAQVESIADAGASEIPTESVTFTASNVTLAFTPQNADGSAGTPITNTFACD
jgi:type VI secretion system Hcp family effector